jgi:hypothetical protein
MWHVSDGEQSRETSLRRPSTSERTNGDIGWPANCHWRGKQRVRMSGAEHVIDDRINGHRNLIDSDPNEA